MLNGWFQSLCMVCVFGALVEGPRLADAADDLAEGERPVESENTLPTVIVPAYFYPNGAGLKEWQRLCADAWSRPGHLAAIVNPASGPGDAIDANYTAVIELAAENSLELYGYVSTAYGKRDLAAVEYDISMWFQRYPGLPGIFLDEQTSGAEKIDFYTKLAATIRRLKPTAKIVSNPGVWPTTGQYLDRNTADVYCVFEGDAAMLAGSGGIPAWAKGVPKWRFYGLTYGIAGRAEAESIRQRADSLGWGHWYVTDARLLPSGELNPWTRLPNYWPAASR